MGRQEVVQHIEKEMHAESNTEPVTDESNSILCQGCGVLINPDDPEQGDYLVHRVPDHGTEKMNSVFYCSQTCFQQAMTALFEN